MAEARSLGPDAWDELESIIARFEDAWNGGQQPALDAYLPAGATERAAVLVELVHADLEFRLRAGEAARVESYLARYPDLARDRGVLRALVVREYELRRPHEPRLTPTDILSRFPQFQQDLADVLPTMPLAPASADAGGNGPGSAAQRRVTRTNAKVCFEAEVPDVAGYRISGVLGRGGMGVVYQAQHLRLDRVVALKMILAGPLATPEQLARFLTEARSVARLQHPNIAQVHEIGDYQGQPFIALEYVGGGSLDKRLAGVPQPARDAGVMVEILARAIHAAHQCGIVHRDLKPANVLLTELGQLKISDFGLAKQLDDDAGQTHSGAIIGTPSYMAPEQAAGRSKQVGPATDGYALGAILYELLTGRPPFRAPTVRDTLEQVCSVDPVAPRRLQPKVPRDLETICLKCLQKDIPRRYSSAQALADDLHRWLSGEPILARPTSGWERALKWVRRHPAATAAYGLLVLVAVLGSIGGGATLLWQRAEQAHREVSVARDQLTEAVERTEVALRREEQAKQREVDARRREAEATERLAHLSYLHRVSLAHREWQDHQVAEAERLLMSCERRLRHWEWHYVHRLCHLDQLTFTGHADSVHGIAFHPDGRRLASSSTDGTVKIWDGNTGQEILTIQAHKGAAMNVVFSPDGRQLASGGYDGKVKILETATGQEVRTITGHTQVVVGVCYSPDGQRLASSGLDGTVRVWDATTGRELLTLRGQSPVMQCVCFSPDGQRLAGAGRNGTVKLWDTRTGQEESTLKGHTDAVFGVCFSPDGKRLATASEDATVRLWEAATAQETFALKGHTARVFHVVFSPDGQRLASSSEDQSVRLWDAATGQAIFSITGHTSWVYRAAFSPDGQRLATASRDHTVKVWDATRGQGALTLQHPPNWRPHLAFSPDGRRLAGAGGDRTVRIWDATTGRETLTLQDPGGRVYRVAFSADGRRLADAGDSGIVRIWDTATGHEQRALRGHQRSVYSVAFDREGRLLGSAGEDQTVRVWDALTGEEKSAVHGHTAVVFSPDFQYFAGASQHQTVTICEAATGRELFVLRGHDAIIACVCASADFKRLASVDLTGVVKIWDATTGRELHSFLGHRMPIHGAAFSPDGQRLATASYDKTVRLWDAMTGQEVLILRGHAEKLAHVVFSPDGRRLASAGLDGCVKVWDATPAESRSAAMRSAKE